MKRAALKSVMMAIGIIGMAGSILRAQDWVGTTSSDWNTTTNWNPTMVPGSASTATFSTSPTTTVTFTGNNLVGGMSFTSSAPVYTFQLSTAYQYLYFEGTGITNASTTTAPIFNLTNANSLGFVGSSTAGNATINLQNSSQASFQGSSSAGTANITASNLAEVGFSGSATAGSATITNTIADGNAGVTGFYNTSNAGSAIILNENGGSTNFHDMSSAQSSQITNTSGGYTYFTETSSGGNATLINNNGATIFFASSSMGNGAITNENGGYVNFSDSSSAGNAVITNDAGGTTIISSTASGDTARIINDGGTLDISGLTNAGTTVGTIEGTGSIVLGAESLTILGRSDNVATTYSGTISGTGGSLNLEGTGSLYLTGANTYTGGTSLSAGTLISGNASSLGTGSMTQTGGTLQTDGISRTINVGGIYDQEAGTLAFTVNNSGNDKMVITGPGSSTFNGTLDVDFTGYTTLTGEAKGVKVITLVTTADGYTQNLTFNPTNLIPADSVTLDTTTNPDDILLDVTTQAGLFTLPGGLTPNERAVVTYINSALNNGKTNTAILALGGAVTANPGSLAVDLNQLMPLNFAHFTSSTAFNNASFFSERMDNYFANHRGSDGTFVGSNGGLDYSGLTYNDAETAQGLQEIHSRLLAWNPAPSTGLLNDSDNSVLGGIDMKDSKSVAGGTQPTQPWNVFLSGNVVLAQNFSDAATNEAHQDTTTAGMELGVDYAITPHFLVGALFGYGHTWADLDNIDSNATVDTYSPGVYASYSDKGWYANALGTYGFSNYSQQRNVSIGAFSGSANSSPSGDQILGNLDGGYDSHQGKWTFGPTAGVQYVHLDVDSYSETGLPGADLDVNKDQSDSLRSRLGGRVSYVFEQGGVVFTPHLDASWQHEFLDQSRGITSQFDGLGAGSFLVSTQNPSRDSALLDTGLDAQLDKSVTLFVDYTVQAGQDNYFGQSVQAGVKVGF